MFFKENTFPHLFCSLFQYFLSNQAFEINHSKKKFIILMGFQGQNYKFIQEHYPQCKAQINLMAFLQFNRKSKYFHPKIVCSQLISSLKMSVEF